MLHPVHRIRLYKKTHHRLIALATLLVPLLILLAIGMITKSETGDILVALSVSWYRLVIGYALSLVIGVTVALALGTSKLGESLTPVLDVMQNIPSFALIPVFALMFGFTDLMAIIFITSSAVWPILFYVLSSIRNAKTDLNEAATIFGARGWKRVRYYLLPLAFPSILTASIIAISIGWEAVIGIEIIGFKNGIGVLLNHASEVQNHSLLVGGIGVLLFFVFILNRVLWTPLIAKTHAYAD